MKTIVFKRVKLFVIALIIMGGLINTSFSFKHETVTPSSLELLNKTAKAISEIKTLRYELRRNERVNGKMNYTVSNIKMQVSPRKMYLSIGSQEVLWLEGKNSGNALINPGAFPYVNLNLDPMGSLMRKNQHHTIFELGMTYFGEILKTGIKRYASTIDKNFVMIGEEQFADRTCYKLSISFSDFAWESYTIKKGETVLTVAKKMNVSEFMILEKNSQLSWYDDVKDGQTIQVPNVYAKQILLLIDKESFLPLSEKILDDKGIFETYEFYNLKVNTAIADEEFSKDFKDYHF